MTRRVHRSALVAAPAERMFDLIDHVEDYPQFLPWCVATRLIERRDDQVSATVTVGWKHLRIEVTTRNPKRVPERMEIHLEGGTFRHFLGLWELRPLGSRGCKVDFTLEYELALPGADRVAGQLIDHAADRMVDAFVERAEREPEATRGTPALALDAEIPPSPSPSREQVSTPGLAVGTGSGGGLAKTAAVDVPDADPAPSPMAAAATAEQGTEPGAAAGSTIGPQPR